MPHIQNYGEKQLKEQLTYRSTETLCMSMHTIWNNGLLTHWLNYTLSTHVQYICQDRRSYVQKNHHQKYRQLNWWQAVVDIRVKYSYIIWHGRLETQTTNALTFQEYVSTYTVTYLTRHVQQYVEKSTYKSIHVCDKL